MAKDANYTQPKIVTDLLEAVRKMPSGEYQYEALQVVLFTSGSNALDVLEQCAHSLNPDVFKIAALASIASISEREEQHRLLDETIEAVRNTDALKGFCIIHLVLPAITEEPVSAFAPQLVDIAQSIETQEERMATLAALLPFLSDGLLQTTLRQVTDYVPQLFDPALRTFVVQRLASELTSDLVSGVLSESPKNWFEALVRDRGLQLFTAAWAHLWPDLNQIAQEQALMLTLRIPDMKARAKALAKIARYLSQSQVAIVLKHIYQTANVADRADMLLAVVPAVSDAQLDGFLVALQTLDGGYTTSDILTTLASHLSSDQFTTILSFLERHNASYDDFWKADVLKGIGTHIPINLSNRAIAVAVAITSPRPRFQALLALAANLSSPEYDQLLDLLAQVVAEIDMHETLKAIARSVPVEFVPRFLEICMQQEAFRVIDSLAILAARMPAEQRGQIIRTARALPGRWKIRALASLEPYTNEDLISEILYMARITTNLDERVDAIRALIPYLSKEWWQEWLQLVTETAHEADKSSKAVLPEEQAQGISARHFDADRLLAEYLGAVPPQYQGDLLHELLSELRSDSNGDKSRMPEALAQVLDYSSNESLAINRGLIFTILLEICDDDWVQSLARHQSELPSAVWKLGAGVALRHSTRSSYYAARNALDMAVAGVPLHLIGINGEQKDPVGGGPGDVLMLFFNRNLLRPRQQLRKLSVIAPQQVEIGKSCLIQVNLTLASRESTVQFVPARTTELIVEVTSIDGSAKFDSGRVQMVDMAWDKDVSPIVFEVTMTKLGNQGLHVTVKSSQGVAIIETATANIELNVLASEATNGYRLVQTEFAIEPPQS